MTLTESLEQLRTEFLAGRDRMLIGHAPFWLHHETIGFIAAGDEALAEQMIATLDTAVPGGNFHVWLDRGEPAPDGRTVYAQTQRAASEVARAIATAAERARAMEAAES